ncbi:hypothetical protein TDIS_1879 [Thermosulfurimonas dismutans]|uniref:Uncharacterized protein n=1 Tax=Thermosulfurimonas dismutans TaxID=999894 RepID=A0A179D1X7_9BACT|nr:hypothetical protein TDIS_1879 [Thermosulfurimonas dismutans]
MFRPPRAPEVLVELSPDELLGGSWKIFGGLEFWTVAFWSFWGWGF